MAENAPYNKESLLVPVPVRRPIKSQHINIAINEQKATNDHAVMLAWRAGRQTTWWSEVPKQTPDPGAQERQTGKRSNQTTTVPATGTILQGAASISITTILWGTHRPPNPDGASPRRGRHQIEVVNFKFNRSFNCNASSHRRTIQGHAIRPRVNVQTPLTQPHTHHTSRARPPPTAHRTHRHRHHPSSFGNGRHN